MSELLEPYVEDASETSCLSLDDRAHFWRRLLESYPEMVDFLLFADDATMVHFRSFVQALYSDFFMQKGNAEHHRVGVMRALWNGWKGVLPCMWVC